MSVSELPLLNIYEVEDDGRTRHFVGFLDPVLAGARGIDPQAMIGEFTPDPAGEFDLATFRVNSEFLAAFTQFMNEVAIQSPEINAQARTIPGQRLYLIDPRNLGDPDVEPPAADVLGAFEIDAEGSIVPESFSYNNAHMWFSPESGVSGMLEDRGFYDWLNPVAPRDGDHGASECGPS